MGQKQETDELSEAETKRRAEAALKKMLATPHKPHAAKGKKKASRGKRPSRRHP